MQKLPDLDNILLDGLIFTTDPSIGEDHTPMSLEPRGVIILPHHHLQDLTRPASQPASRQGSTSSTGTFLLLPPLSNSYLLPTFLLITMSDGTAIVRLLASTLTGFFPSPWLFPFAPKVTVPFPSTPTLVSAVTLETRGEPFSTRAVGTLTKGPSKEERTMGIEVRESSRGRGPPLP